ncbi:hypothetical protein NS183_18755 [Microbacterium testaceum]|nr:hypothetical protein NS183_18755 [Microbacterium testaceum]
MSVYLFSDARDSSTIQSTPSDVRHGSVVGAGASRPQVMRMDAGLPHAAVDCASVQRRSCPEIVLGRRASTLAQAGSLASFAGSIATFVLQAASPGRSVRAASNARVREERGTPPG